MKAALALVAACGFPRPADVSTDGGPPLARSAMKSFSFPADLNALPHDLVGSIGDGTIDLYTYGPTAPAMETAHFEPVSGTVSIGDVAQTDRGTPNDFSKAQTYTVHGDDGSTMSYVVTLHRRLFSPGNPNSVANASGMAIGDLDGDGLADVVIATSTGTIFVALGAASTSPQAALGAVISYPMGLIPTALALTDVDGDGRPDLVFANKSSGGAYQMHNISTRGVPAFEPAVSVTALGSTIALAGADFNGDTLGDCVGANGGSADVVFTSSNGPGTASLVQAGDTVAGLAALDANDDGLADLALSTSSGVQLFVNQTPPGGTTFAFDGNTPHTFPIPGANAMAVGDIDGDGADDLLVVSSGGPTLLAALYHLNGDGRSAGISTAGSTKIAAACLVDLDGDGRADPVALYPFSNGTGEFVLWITGEDTSFKPAGKGEYGDTTALACGTGDFNGDGSPELAVLTADQFLLLSLMDQP